VHDAALVPLVDEAAIARVRSNDCPEIVEK